jgi:hypothetical protein
MCETVTWLRPFQSTKDLDGLTTDREVVQDIAYDGQVPTEGAHQSGPRRVRYSRTAGQSARVSEMRGRKSDR